MTSIYALTDPRSSEIRYIGKTKQPLLTRLNGHKSNRQPVPVALWVKELRGKGLSPSVVEIEAGLTQSEWPAAEKFWIDYFNFLGANLTNQRDNRAVSEATKRRDAAKRMDSYWKERFAPKVTSPAAASLPVKLSMVARDMLDYLKVVMDKQNVAIAPVGEIQERTDMSTASIARAKAQLLEMDYIRQRTPHVYMVNPGYACKTAGDDRQAVYEAYSMLPFKGAKKGGE